MCSRFIGLQAEGISFHVVDILRLFLATQGRVRNGRKTAVMDIIGFLCVSLGSSTVHLHGTVGSRHACTYSDAGFSSQNGDRA
jgi:hypothetical protein